MYTLFASMVLFSAPTALCQYLIDNGGDSIHRQTHANPDTLRDNLAPDVAVYAADNVPYDEAKTNFSKMELFVELKFAETSDPFRDPNSDAKVQFEP